MSEFGTVLTNRFGPKTTILRSKVHDYFWMDLDFGNCSGTMIIYMMKYLQKIINGFIEVLRGTKTCPTGDTLLKVRDDEDRELLSEEMTKQFHRMSIQLLFMCKRERSTAETCVSFLTNGMKQSGKDEWGKLRHSLIDFVL